MNAVVPFPDRNASRDLSKNAAGGYAAITRKVERIIADHDPAPQAARLIVRASVLMARTFVPKAELVQAIRDLADEVEASR